MSFAKGAVGTAIVAAGLIAIAIGTAQSQTRRPYIPVSDFEEPYSALPPGPPPRPLPPPRYGGPPIMNDRYAEPAPIIAPTEVYRVLRENGFSPLGIPRQRGPVYTISAINLANGDDGRVVIDARTGRVIRFVPGWRLGDAFNRMPVSYESARPLPPMRGDLATGTLAPATPRIARTYAPAEAVPRAEVKPAPQRTAAAPPPTTSAPVAARPVPSIAPTQDMPAAQGLE